MRTRFSYDMSFTQVFMKFDISSTYQKDLILAGQFPVSNAWYHQVKLVMSRNLILYFLDIFLF